MSTELSQLQQIEREALTIACRADARAVIARLASGLREYRAAVVGLLDFRGGAGDYSNPAGDAACHEVDGATMSVFIDKINDIENCDEDYLAPLLTQHQAVDLVAVLVPEATAVKFRARVDEQMALRDSRAARDDDEDRPSTAVAQLRELASWLRAEGESSKADDADELAEAIAFKYEVV